MVFNKPALEFQENFLENRGTFLLNTEVTNIDSFENLTENLEKKYIRLEKVLKEKITK